jgi:hypothetical protein
MLQKLNDFLCWIIDHKHFVWELILTGWSSWIFQSVTIPKYHCGRIVNYNVKERLEDINIYKVFELL